MLGWFVGWSLLEYCWAVGLILVVFFVLKKLYFLCSVLLRLTVWLWCQHWIVHLGDHLWPEPKPGCSLGPLEQLGRLLPPPVLPIFHCWALGILHGVDSTCIIRRKVFVEVFIFYFNFIFISFDVFFCIAVWCSVRGARCRRMSRVRSGESQWCRGRTLRTLEADNPNPNGTWCMAHGGRFMAGAWPGTFEIIWMWLQNTSYLLNFMRCLNNFESFTCFHLSFQVCLSMSGPWQPLVRLWRAWWGTGTLKSRGDYSIVEHGMASVKMLKTAPDLLGQHFGYSFDLQGSFVTFCPMAWRSIYMFCVLIQPGGWQRPRQGQGVKRNERVMFDLSLW